MIMSRKWAMPNKKTFSIKPIKNLIKSRLGYNLRIVDPFANECSIRSIIDESCEYISNDLNTKYNTDYHMNALEFLKTFKDNSVDLVLYDPPYSPRQIKECYNNIGRNVTQVDTQSNFWGDIKNEISRILKNNGTCISFGWNSGGIGKTKGFVIDEILLVAHGGNHNDTICTVDKKII